MATKNLHVPFFSQWDEDAGQTKNDCGPCALKMILNYYGEKLTTNEIFAKTEAGEGAITVSQLQKAITFYDYISQYEKNCSTEKLKELIDKNTPPIALVHYGDLQSRQDKNYKGGHFFVVVGYRDDGYFVNDPNFWGDYRKDGDHHFYTKEEFENAWQNCTKDSNPKNSLLIILPKEESASNYYKGIDLNNKDSVKVCVDAWKEVIDGNYAKKEELITLQKNLKDNDRAWKERVENEVNNHLKLIKEIASKLWPEGYDETKPQEAAILEQITRFIQAEDNVTSDLEPRITELKERIAKIARILGVEDKQIEQTIEKLKEEGKIEILSIKHSRFCAWLAKIGL